MKYKFKHGEMKIGKNKESGGAGLPHEDIKIIRHEYGVPVIKALNLEDAYYGMGIMHAYDRMFQMWFVKVLFEGRASEYFGNRDDLIGIDKYFRTLNFRPAGVSHSGGKGGSAGSSAISRNGTAAESTDRDNKDKSEEIPHNISGWLNAYIAGIEDFRKTGYRPFEFRLTGLKPEPWEREDIFALSRVMAYVGLAESQGAAEKVITEIILQDKRYFNNLGRLFNPYFKGYDYDWFAGIKLKSPLSENVLFDNSIGGSNNWAVSGKLTDSGKPIFCNDPHLEISRLPSIWYEVIVDTPGNWFTGITVPGAPVVASGWNGKYGWGMTFTSADMVDFFIERCKDGKYLKDGRYHPFRERKETIKTKKGRSIDFTVYENEHGFLEGDPYRDGVYLSRKWSGMEGILEKTLVNFLQLPLAGSVKEGIKLTANIDIPSLNWVFADKDGNIGFKMGGIIPRRKKGLSGLLPIPGWDSSYGWDGYLKRDKLPELYNPEQGFIVTANNRLDRDLKGVVQNLPFSSDRADRISEMLMKLKPLDHKKMGEIQMDVYSRQARRVLDFLRPYLEKDPYGSKLLLWDCRFTPESIEATVFEDFYKELMLITGSGILFPEKLGRVIYEETFFFILIHQLVEEEWMKKDGLFKDVNWDSAVKEALERIKNKRKVPWGKRNSIKMKHLLLGDTLFKCLGFNAGPYPLRGSKSTVHQGTMFRFGNRDMSFGPSFRMIADFCGDIDYTVMPGGASGRRFSGYYKREIKNWLTGKYKVITRQQ